MDRRDTIVSLAVVLGLALLSILGIGHVREKHSPENILRFQNRLMKLEALGVQPQDGVAVTYEDDAMRLAWPQADAPQEMESALLPLEQSEKKALQVDISIGGQQNAHGHLREKYRIWLELRLLQGDATVKAKRIEVPLESGLGRPRLYAIRIPYENTEPDAYRLRWIVEPVEGHVAQGFLVCQYVEVMEL